MNKKRDLVLSLILVAVVCVLLFIVDQNYHYSMLSSVIQKGAIYALLAVSLNLLNGFTGLFSLGQAGFMLIGAYTYAILTIPVSARESVYQYFDGGIVQFALPKLVAMLLAGILAAGFAYLVGKPVLRLKSDYLAIATLGFAEILRAIVQWNQIGPLTNASNILKKFPKYTSIFFPVVVAAICIGIIVLLIHSSYGRAFRAIRDDEIAAEAMGINLAHHKIMAFVISGFFAGIGGALLAMFSASVQAKSFTSAMTYEILLIVVIGGIGSITGSVIGSFLYIACSEWWLRFLDDPAPYFGSAFAEKFSFMRGGFRMVVFSVVIMIIVLFYRQGIMGTHEFSWQGIINFLKHPFGLGKKKASEGKAVEKNA
jgi:branched-chain amino acid transport system permease protein